jgi:transposase
MGLILDPVAGRRRVVWALIFTACFSRHYFVWLAYRQRLVDVIEGFEAAWVFFGGVFKVVIPDCVVEADDVNPRFNEGFVEYAQCRGFVVTRLGWVIRGTRRWLHVASPGVGSIWTRLAGRFPCV